MRNIIQQDAVILKSVIEWFEKAVLGLNLCPFAARPYAEETIVFSLSAASDDESCLTDVFLSLKQLDEHPETETLIMICSNHLARFEDYNQFLALADKLLEQEGWQGIYQIASFHPDYRFAETTTDARENWTNRSPYPLLHFLRETSLDKAIRHFPEVDKIPQKNVQTMEQLSDQQMLEIFGTRFSR